MPTTTINEKASEAYECFETATRDDDTTYDRIRDGSPEWVTELARAAHSDMLPDGWRYNMIRQSLAWLADGGDKDGDEIEQLVPVYTGRLLTWLGSNLTRTGYCDEAMQDIDCDNIVGAIAAGYGYELREVFFSVVESCREK